MLAGDHAPGKYRVERKIEEASYPADGRRIYLHNYSLRCLARHSVDLAEQLTSLLAEVRAAKIVHHHVVELGVELGLVREPVADQFFQSEWKAKLSAFFRSLGYRPSFPADKSLFLRLIDPGEQIIASCSDSGYYTFATGVSASDRMFADDVPIPTLQKSLNRGDGPADLTMIRGNSLAPVDGALGVGAVGHQYGSLVLTSFSLTEAELDAIDETARAGFMEMFQARIALAVGQLTADEQQVYSDAVRSIERSFERGGSLSLS